MSSLFIPFWLLKLKGSLLKELPKMSSNLLSNRVCGGETWGEPTITLEPSVPHASRAAACLCCLDPGAGSPLLLSGC